MRKTSPRGSGRKGTSFHLDGKLTRTSCCRFNNRVIEANADIPSRFRAVCFDMVNGLMHMYHMSSRRRLLSSFINLEGVRSVCLAA
jgi:hypothetical protein